MSTNGFRFRVGVSLLLGLIWTSAALGQGPLFGPAVHYPAGDAPFSVAIGDLNGDQAVRLALRGVYFVPNQGQWADGGVRYGFRSRGLDVALRESALTLHLRRERSTADTTESADGAESSGRVSEPPTQIGGHWAPHSRAGFCHHAAGTLLESFCWAAHSRTGFCYPLLERGAYAEARDSRLVPGIPLSARSVRPASAGVLRGSGGDALEDESLVLRVTFPGSNAADPIGVRPRAARFNYFLGDDESKWRSGVPSFGAVVYEDLYDGIDLHVTGSDAGV
ncbi:hypothetical protein LCGC14_1170990, partial [marine sediment metagenome]